MARARAQMSAEEVENETPEPLPLVAPQSIQAADELPPEGQAPMPSFPVRDFAPDPNAKPAVGDFVVVNASKIAVDGCVYVLPAGRVINSSCYDLDTLRAQGVQLVPAT